MYINPNLFTDEQLSKIIAHETVHINQLHTVDSLMYELLIIFFWFNPIAYKYRKSAKELHEYLKQEALFNPKGDIKDSEFYISVPNEDNPNNKIDTDGRFPYDYKYGRNAHEIQEYVKVVPFSRDNISYDILTRFQEQIPYVYQLMQNFNQTSEKTEHLEPKSKI